MKNLLYIGNHLPSILPTGIHSLSENLRKEGYAVITASGRQGKLWRLTEMLASVYRNREWADYVLIDTYSTRNFWFAYAVARLCQRLGLKYIPILHGGELPRRFKENPQASRLVFEQAYKNVAPSRYLQRAMSKFFNESPIQPEEFLANNEGTSTHDEESSNRSVGTRFIASTPPESIETPDPSNIEYIPNSLKLPMFPFHRRTNFRPRLFWVRAFQGIYHPLLALKVLEQVLRKYPGAELCMVGPKKEDAALEECWEYALQRSLPVKFPGKLGKEEWIGLSRDYDIFLNTTNIDNTPLSVIEAMALGMVVVSTDVGGLPDLIETGEEGFLVPADNIEAMTQAVEAVLEHPEHSLEVTLAARTKVEKFDWEIVRHVWGELLQ